MIVANLMGGLGNQLFQYAAGRSLAIHHATTLGYFFDDGYTLAKRSLKIDNFNLQGRFVQPEEIKAYLPKRKLTRRAYKLLGLNYDGLMYREMENYGFDPAFFNVPERAYLYGFWQSYRYFEGIEKILRQDLVIKNPSAPYQAAVEKIANLPNPVSFHIRRGDYLVEKSGFSIVPESYYQEAIAFIMHKFGYFTPVIFSDDTDWVKSHFSFLKDPIFATDFYLKDFEEMMAMSLCKHQVIANSSFSWWGAWLNVNPKKCVIAPKEWHILHTEKSTLIPDNWIRLS